MDLVGDQAPDLPDLRQSLEPDPRTQAKEEHGNHHLAEGANQLRNAMTPHQMLIETIKDMRSVSGFEDRHPGRPIEEFRIYLSEMNLKIQRLERERNELIQQRTQLGIDLRNERHYAHHMSEKMKSLEGAKQP